MKKSNFYCIIFIAFVCFVSCEKNNEVKIKDEPGNVSGMGEAGGQLQVNDFLLPSGVEIMSSISGVLEDEGTISTSEILKSSNNNKYYGSGGRYIKVKFKIKNNTIRPCTVFFPAGLVFKVINEGYQCAILLQWTWMCFRAGEVREIILDLYCINKNRTISLINSEFVILGITSSRAMQRLIEECGLKKINIEFLSVVSPKTGLKSTISYDEITSSLQDAVWSITNGAGLSNKQIDFIRSLPELDKDLLPPNFGEPNFEPPYYWNEYGE